MMSLAIERAIRKVIEDVGDPLMEHILSRVHAACPGIWTNDAIREATLSMVNRGVLRMKEDCVDHDWSYRKGSEWNS